MLFLNFGTQKRNYIQTSKLEKLVTIEMAQQLRACITLAEEQAHTFGCSQLPVTPTPKESNAFTLHWHLNQMHIPRLKHTQRYTIKNKKKSKMKTLSIF